MYQYYKEYVVKVSPTKDLSQGVSSKLRAGQHILTVKSIIPVRDCVDIVLENDLGERFRNRLKVWSDGERVTNELVDFLEPFCKKNIYKFLTDMHDSYELKQFENQQVRVTLEYTEGYKVYSNPTNKYYSLVDSKGNELTEEQFDSFKSAKAYADKHSLRPAGMRVTKWIPVQKTI